MISYSTPMDYVKTSDFVMACLRAIVRLAKGHLIEPIVSFDKLCEFLDTLIDDAESHTSLLLLYNGMFSYNRSGRLRFITLMNNILVLANSYVYTHDVFENDSLLRRFLYAS